MTVNGTGDATTALVLGNWLRSSDVAQVVQEMASAMYELVRRTYETDPGRSSWWRRRKLMATRQGSLPGARAMTDEPQHEPIALRRLSVDPVLRIPPASLPVRSTLAGRYVRLEPLDPMRHASGLFAASQGPEQDTLWRYLPYGPFASEAAMRGWLVEKANSVDPLFYAICTTNDGPLGMAALLNIQLAAGSIEAGHIWFGFPLQRTVAATEAVYLLIAHALERGYRGSSGSATLPTRRHARQPGGSASSMRDLLPCDRREGAELGHGLVFR